MLPGILSITGYPVRDAGHPVMDRTIHTAKSCQALHVIVPKLGEPELEGTRMAAGQSVRGLGLGWWRADREEWTDLRDLGGTIIWPLCFLTCQTLH